jgi:DNA-binding CsgD family transcriptional regulator
MKLVKFEQMEWKQLVLYSMLLAGLLFGLEVIHYRTIVRDVSLETYSVVIAMLFLVLGIWLGGLRHQKKSLRGTSKMQKLGLSDREMEVLSLMAAGLSNQQIADKLFVSLNTVKTHVSNVLMKLNATRRTQAIQRAIELQIINPSKE